jgi:hypothetical protein
VRRDSKNLASRFCIPLPVGGNSRSSLRCSGTGWKK